MKNTHKLIGLGTLLLPSIIFADNGLDDGINMVASTGTLFGTIIVVIAVALWMMPIAFAGLVYTGQKKKAEQMHEDVGLKAAMLALLAGVLGAAMAFYLVGSIGQYAGSAKDTLKGGNGYLIKAIVGTAVDRMNPTSP